MSTGRKRADLRVLLVDDYWINQKVAARMLEKLGVTTELAENGARALQLVEEQPFDLILMDMQMPVMDGLEATEKIRALGDALADLPIIAMTAADGDADAERCLQAGMNDVIHKPVELEALERVLDEIANR